MVRAIFEKPNTYVYDESSDGIRNDVCNARIIAKVKFL